jgi:hypothetical protein
MGYGGFTQLSFLVSYPTWQKILRTGNHRSTPDRIFITVR